MAVTDFVPVLIQISLVVFIGVAIIAASHIFGQRGTPGKIKDSPYECGIPVSGKTRTRYAVKFYITAMLFLLFDIEVVFLIPFVLTFREFVAAGMSILGPMMIFFSLLVIGLFYEVRKGALEWEK